MTPIIARLMVCGRSSKKLENTPLWKLNLFPCSDEGKETPTLLASLEREVEWLRLAISEGSNKVSISFPSPEDGNGSSFRNVVLPSYLEFRIRNKVLKHSDSERSNFAFEIILIFYISVITEKLQTLRQYTKRIRKTPGPHSASQLYRPSDRRLSTKLVPTFADFPNKKHWPTYGRYLVLLYWETIRNYK
jgi:hypothetical protein